MNTVFALELVSETDLLLRFEAALTPTLIQRLQFIQSKLHTHFRHALADSVLAYQTLLLSFSPTYSLPLEERSTLVSKLTASLLTQQHELPPTHTIELPVYYGPEAGEDFDYVCKQTQLTAEELIAAHSGTPYYVYALGFSPGFGFLGELPAALHLPRRDTPRLQVPVGSVAMAHNQTAVYPQASPGGWHLIGRCPTRLFSRHKTPPNLLRLGCEVRFAPISRQEFLQRGGKL